MLQLFQPIWLFALAGLSIPVIIHLWNRPPGKILRVGSIALVKKNASRYKKRIQISRILLLLLRCLLLACIATALAGPLWRRPALYGSKGWVLMTRDELPVAYNRFKPLVDSLLRAGLEFHYFEEGFEKEKLEKALSGQITSNAVQQASYRGLIALLNEQVGPHLPLYIFTDNYLRNFTGSRPMISLNLHWLTYTPDTADRQPFADTTSLQATIFSRGYANDARYLQAALEAIRQFSKKNIVIKPVAAVKDIPGQQDWLFWLDDEIPVYIKNAKNVLVYVKGEPVKYVSSILPVGSPSFAAVSLYKSVIEKDTAKQFLDACWQDGFGHPILSVERKDNNAYYRLYTHFDPGWNELPWSDNFPAILYKLLYQNRVQESLAGATDKTIIDSLQLMPVVSASRKAGAGPAAFTETNLAGVCWLMAFALFFAERCLSFYHYKKTPGG